MEWTDDYILSVYSIFSAILLMIVMNIFTSRYWEKKKLNHIKFTDCQSVVIDEKTGLRASVRKLKVPDIHLLKTPLDFFKRGLEKSRHKPCFGTREALTSPVKWITYAEVYEKIQLMGSALTKLMGENPKNNFVGIYGRNSPEWVITQLANTAYSFVTVPLYSTFGTEAITHVCSETELRIITCDTVAQAYNLYKLMPKYIETFIVMKPDDTYPSVKKELSDKVKLFTFEEMLERGRSQRCTMKEAKDNDLFMICYTSGSLGLPKGVMLTCKAYVNAIHRTISIQEENYLAMDDVAYLSYLPLSHLMEQLTLAFALFFGAQIGFLTTDIKSLFDDLKVYKPSFFVSVPRIITRVYGNFSKKLRSRPLLWRICEREIKRRIEEQKQGIYCRSGLFDFLFFREFREMLGGRVSAIISGSSAIDRDVLLSTRAIFGCPVIEVYGSTETFGIVTSTMFEDIDANHVGSISSGIQIKLIDVPDMNILVSRDGMGEICVRSPCNMIGYYKNEEKTNEALDSDGYVHTGDVGKWTENGALKIVDRTKNLFKLSQGEYIAPEKVEQTYLACNLIQQVYVEGHQHRSYAVAIVKPDFKQLRKQARDIISKSSQTKSLITQVDGKLSGEKQTDEIANSELCTRKEIRKFILEQMNKIARQKGLKGFELAQIIFLTPEAFTINNGLLTPTLKLARANLRRHFADIIINLYEEKEEGF